MDKKTRKQLTEKLDELKGLLEGKTKKIDESYDDINFTNLSVELEGFLDSHRVWKKYDIIVNDEETSCEIDVTSFNRGLRKGLIFDLKDFLEDSYDYKMLTVKYQIGFLVIS